jgi:hypothetical protein
MVALPRMQRIVPMKKKKKWIDELSHQAKAEILTSVLHALEECESPKVWRKLPKRIQKLILRAQCDCGIWSKDLSSRDTKNIREWFKEFHES